MSIFSKSHRQVKPTRRTPRPASRFGSGILATHPVVMAPFNFADEAWACNLFNDPLSASEYDAREREYDEMIDDLALADAMLERYTRGLIG